MQIGWRILREIASSKNIHTQTMIFFYSKPIKIYKRQCRPLNSFKHDGYNFHSRILYFKLINTIIRSTETWISGIITKVPFHMYFGCNIDPNLIMLKCTYNRKSRKVNNAVYKVDTLQFYTIQESFIHSRCIPKWTFCDI